MSRRSATRTGGWFSHYRELIGSWAKRNSNPQDAEDAAQDAMVSVLNSDGGAVLDRKAYLFRAARNRLIDEIRRRARTECVPLEDLAESEHPLLTDPESDLRAAQLAGALERALSRVPLKKRQAYMWHRLEGYTQQEVADRMGLALNTIERYIMDTTRQMRDDLQDFCDDPDDARLPRPHTVPLR